MMMVAKRAQNGYGLGVVRSHTYKCLYVNINGITFKKSKNEVDFQKIFGKKLEFFSSQNGKKHKKKHQR